VSDKSDIVERLRLRCALEFDEQYLCDAIECEAADEIKRLRSEIARLREERRWVPVGERLPEHGDSVWVFDGTHVVIGEYWGTWQSYGASCDREGLNSETLIGITHWTKIREPLPPGPEGDG
jgi:hypothetical protein